LMTMASTCWVTESSIRAMTAAISPAVSTTFTSHPFSAARGLKGVKVELRAGLRQIGRDHRNLAFGLCRPRHPHQAKARRCRPDAGVFPSSSPSPVFVLRRRIRASGATLAGRAAFASAPFAGVSPAPD
jgi:hypothetical protein